MSTGAPLEMRLRLIALTAYLTFLPPTGDFPRFQT